VPEGCDRQGASNAIAEHRPRVGIDLLDGRAREADERRIRQGIAQVAGEAVGHLALPFWRKLRSEQSLNLVACAVADRFWFGDFLQHRFLR